MIKGAIVNYPIMFKDEQARRGVLKPLLASIQAILYPLLKKENYYDKYRLGISNMQSNNVTEG